MRSLRFRLVVTFVVVVGLINAVLGGAGIALRDWQVRTRFDERLAQRTDRLALWLQPRLGQADDLATVLDHPGRPFAGEELFVALVADDGRVVAKTANTGDADLSPERGDGAGAYATLSGDEAAGFHGRPERVRVHRRSLGASGGPGAPGALQAGYTLRVGADLSEVEESTEYLWNLLWLALPTAMVVAGLAGWVVIGGALRTLRVVSQTASHITPGHLDERIRVTSSDSEINRLVTELNHMLDRLSASFKAQQRFITNASHALQTPVAALLSQAQVLRSGTASDDECRKFVSSVEEEMRQLTRMMSSMLSLIRMESGELERSQRVLSLNDVMVAAVEDLRAAAAAKDVRLQLTLPDPEHAADPDVIGDAGLLQTMVENLVRNAVQFSPAGQSVEVVLELDADQAVVTVSDHGPALSDVAIRSAFDRDAEAGGTGPGGPGAPERTRRGDGMALSMARTIAELHDGTIGLRNRPEGGAAFFVWLPLAEENAA